MNDALGTRLGFDQALDVEAVGQQHCQQQPDPHDRDFARRSHLDLFLLACTSSFRPSQTVWPEVYIVVAIS